MKKLQRRYSEAEFARRGEDILEHQIQPKLQPADDGKFIAIDIETAAFELDEDDFTATERLLARVPNAQIWLARAGRRAAHSFGGRSSPRSRT